LWGGVPPRTVLAALPALMAVPYTQCVAAALLLSS
jgi:hypothetical protein